MATVYLDQEHRLEFERRFATWKRECGEKFYTMPPQTLVGDGRLAYVRVPQEFVAILQRERLPFSIAD